MSPTSPMSYQRGSEWRKWDLHVHCPDDRLQCDWPGNTPQEKWDAFLAVIEKAGVAAVGVTNYFCCDGYEDVLRHQKTEGRLAKVDLVVPNIEFRITQPNKSGEYINMHVLFDPHIGVERIKAFLGRLPQVARGHGDVELHCGEDDMKSVGYKNALVPFEKLRDRLEADFVSGEYLVAAPATGFGTFRSGGSTGRGAMLMDEIDKFCDFVYGRSDNVGYFLDTNRYPDAVAKAVFECSDTHGGTDIGPRSTWVKTDATFAGLRMALREPARRVLIEDMPPVLARLETSSTKYIRAVSVKKTANSNLQEEWFDGATLELNPEMVAIIGNRGSGKSALTDIIALLGNAKDRPFSFLNSEQFRQRPAEKARQFTATIEWASGTKVERNLIDDPPLTEPTLVKYVPQKHFDTICNEAVAQEEGSFGRELKSVIFSRLPPASQLGKGSFSELLTYRTEEIERSLADHRRELHNVNAEIEVLQDAVSRAQRDELDAQVKRKSDELEAHSRNCPAERQKPEGDPEVLKEIEELRGKLKESDGLITERGELLGRHRKLRLSAERLLERFRRFKQQHDTLLAECKSELESLGVNGVDVLSVTLNEQPLDARIKELGKEIIEAEAQLDPGKPSGLAAKKKSLTDAIEERTKVLSGAQLEYEGYLRALGEWERKRTEILGSPDVPGSLDGLKARRASLNVAVPERLAKLRDERRELGKQILSGISRIADVYRELYQPVQEFINQQGFIAEALKLTFKVSVTQVGFVPGFLAHIHQGHNGSFCGVEAGATMLQELMATVDLEQAESALDFAESVEAHLVQDMRDKQNPVPMEIRRQLRESQGITPARVYDYLWSFEYLRPRYDLRLGGRALPQLSPGERGILLLVFYLLVDKDDCPLIIDQPEENLDNQAVSTLLRQCVDVAKQRRQLIVVTHNPNLAVVCDAEQVIRAEMDKTAGRNRITYDAGAIENPRLNIQVVDVLEGTWQAFQNRSSKYIEPKGGAVHD